MGLKKVVIVTPEYAENVGGAVVLHKLAAILQKQGVDVTLYPFVTTFYLGPTGWLKTLGLWLKQYIRVQLALRWQRFRLYPEFAVSLYRGSRRALASHDFLVIYPETVLGNPLQAKHVVRWLLHQPGFHTSEITFGRGDLLVKFNSAIKDVQLDGVQVATKPLKVIHYPLEHYYAPPAMTERHGTAVCIRKGAGKPFVHAEPAIIIDDLSHREVGEIFRRSKYFVSYDTYTAYSLFAVLCGCISIVVPDADQTEQQWYPDIQDRWGIAYGFDKIEFAQETAHLQVERILQQVQAVDDNVQQAFAEMCSFFKSDSIE
jgi:hypothetical protein